LFQADPTKVRWFMGKNAFACSQISESLNGGLWVLKNGSVLWLQKISLQVDQTNVTHLTGNYVNYTQNDGTNAICCFYAQRKHLYTQKKRIFMLILIKFVSGWSDKIWRIYSQKTCLRAANLPHLKNLWRILNFFHCLRQKGITFLRWAQLSLVKYYNLYFIYIASKSPKNTKKC